MPPVWERQLEHVGEQALSALDSEPRSCDPSVQWDRMIWMRTESRRLAAGSSADQCTLRKVESLEENAVN